MNIAPDTFCLSLLEKGDKETVCEYAQRLRDLVTKVHTLLLDKEMVTLFVNTLKGHYYEHVMGSSTQWFTNVVVVAEGFKQGI
jgi:phosphoribosylamine-glycine ligase